MFRIVSGFVLLCRLTHIQLPNSLPVRQARDLPPASFRFLLTEDTLALSCYWRNRSHRGNWCRWVEDIERNGRTDSKYRRKRGFLSSYDNYGFLWAKDIFGLGTAD